MATSTIKRPYPYDETVAADITFRKQGGIVTVHSVRTVSITGGQYTTLSGTLPEAFRPSAARSIPVLFGANASLAGLLAIGTDGTIKVFCNATVNSEMWACGVYSL